MRPKYRKGRSEIHFTALAQALSRNRNLFLRLAEMLLSSYRARACGIFDVPRFELFRSAISNEVGKHLCSTYQKQGYQGKKAQRLPPWCREAHQHSQDGTVRPIRDGPSRTLT
jgi:hypothetical protein